MKRKKLWEELSLRPPSKTARPPAGSGNPEQLKALQDQLRSNCSRALSAALQGEGASEVAAAVEEALFELHHRDTGQDYKTGARTLVANLKRNAGLQARVLSGRVAPRHLVRMSTQELATEEQRSEFGQIMETNTRRATLAGAGSGMLSNDYVCSRCGGNTCDFVDRGRRDIGKCETWGSKDSQGPTRAVTCLSCGNKWESDDI